MHHLGLHFIGYDVTVWDPLSVVDGKEVGEKCSNNRLLEDIEVVSFPEQFFRKILVMCQKGVKVLFECNVGKKSEGGYLDFDEAEFSLFVECSQ